MPPRRRISRRKRSLRKRRTMTGRAYRKPVGFLLKRTCALAPVVSGGVYSSNIIQDRDIYQYGYFNFSLSDLPNNGEVTAMFNRYKLTGVKLKFIPIQGTDATAASSNLMNTLALSIDKSVRGVPAAFDELMEAGNVKVYASALRPISVWISRPLAAATIGGSSAMMTNPWLDSDLNDIKHYGLRYAFKSGVPTTSATRFAVYATYYLRLRGTK